MARMRNETDSLGIVQVPADKLWGAQTQRSLEHFSIGTAADAERFKKSLRLLVGFLLGCLVAAVAVSFMADWAWSLPVVLAALAIAVR